MDEYYGYLPDNVKNWRYKYKPAFALIDKDNKPGIKLTIDKSEITDDGWIVLCETEIK